MLDIPTLSALKQQEQRDLQRRDEQAAEAQAALSRWLRRDPVPHLSMVGHVETIRADRRDAEIMLRYARAKAREDAKGDA